MRAVLAVTLMLSGCSLAQVAGRASPDRAVVLVAHTPAGEPTVVLRAIRKHWVLTQDIDLAEQITLKPGTYVADLECARPGGRLYLHVVPSLRFTVEAGRTYILDCAPSDQGDGFSLRQGPNNSFKPKPLRGSA
jgi:hypothetical protein